MPLGVEVDCIVPTWSVCVCVCMCMCGMYSLKVHVMVRPNCSMHGTASTCYMRISLHVCG